MKQFCYLELLYFQFVFRIILGDFSADITKRIEISAVADRGRQKRDEDQCISFSLQLRARMNFVPRSITLYQYFSIFVGFGAIDPHVQDSLLEPKGDSPGSGGVVLKKLVVENLAIPGNTDADLDAGKAKRSMPLPKRSIPCIQGSFDSGLLAADCDGIGVSIKDGLAVEQGEGGRTGVLWFYAGAAGVDGLLWVGGVVAAAEPAFPEQVGPVLEGIVEVPLGGRGSSTREGLQHRYGIIIELIGG